MIVPTSPHDSRAGFLRRKTSTTISVIRPTTMRIKIVNILLPSGVGCWTKQRYEDCRRYWPQNRVAYHSSHPTTNGHDGQGGSLPQQKRSSSPGGFAAAGLGQRAQ